MAIFCAIVPDRCQIRRSRKRIIKGAWKTTSAIRGLTLDNSRFEWNVMHKFDLPNEAATIALARSLAPALLDGGVVYLRGELGTGKTTFARALLRAMGVGERVKSPTYSLLERYFVNGRDAFHLDLYRIADAGELEWLGLDELDGRETIVLVEWPERGRGALPKADLEITLEHDGQGRSVLLAAASMRGQHWLESIKPVAGRAGR